MIRTIWTFPGQLTEYVGMAKGGLVEGSAALARNLAAASELLGRDLGRLCREGPEALLKRDENAALAVVAVGAAAAEDLRRSGVSPDGVLGYSLGLYTAAAATRAIGLDTALRIVLAIAREGERAFASGDMAMGFVTGLKLSTLEAAIGDVLQAGEIAITNINSQAQLVLAGHGAALEAALARVRPRAIRCERLPIRRPYHSRWMAPVVEAVESICAGVEVSPPDLPLYDHRDGAKLETAEAVRRRLSGQLTSRLDWNASVSRLVADGASVFVEMPPGSSTTRMVRWIARDAICLSIDEPGDRARFLAGVGRRGEGAP